MVRFRIVGEGICNYTVRSWQRGDAVMIRVLAAAQACVLSLMGFAGSAHAITLDLDSDVLDGLLFDGEQSSSEGVTMTFSNVQASDGLPGVFVNDNGIAFANVGSAASQLSFSFNVDVVIESFDVDFNFARNNQGFTITGPNGISGFNSLGRNGDIAFDAGSIGRFRAGEIYTLTHNVRGGVPFVGPRVAQIDEFEVSLAAVPAPLSGALLGGAFGVFFVSRRLKKAKKTA